jgi:2-keto-4-pentenoate hydratase/2-oxohepta-3-ene-1,7-dioic acid hydratase in catechol pathway
MKLLRLGSPGAERPALLCPDGTLRDASSLAADWAGEALSRAALDRVAAAPWRDLPHAPEGLRIGPPVPRPVNFVGIGLNYADHAAETGSPVPREPILFLKSAGSLCGPTDTIQLPPGAEKLDYEVELGVVIGTTARRVAEAEAMDHVAGYCVINDVSERAWQMERSGQWDKGKGADTFGPAGPWLVTADEVPDPQSLDLWLDVDGTRRQTGSTRTMVFGVRALVSYVSQFITLHPGDLIATGTPPGVGMGMKPPGFLRAGQVVTLGISGLGEQRCVVAAA